MRAGANALSLLSVPLNVHVLTALAEEPKSLIDLRRAAGSPPQTTTRGHLRALTRIGVLERRHDHESSGAVNYELGPPGRDLLAVAGVLQDWLEGSPHGEIPLGSVAAKSSIKALVEGWSTRIVRFLAARPLALTELSRLITDISYPSLERRIVALRHAGQIQRCVGNGRARPYEASDWLRRAIGPLAAGARWERIYLRSDAPPIGRIDVESFFLLTVSLIDLSGDRSGVCRLAVEVQGWSEEAHPLAGVMVEVRDGEVVSCIADLRGDVAAWASGSLAAWLQAVIDCDAERLEIGGDRDLALDVIDGLNSALFLVRQRT